MAKSKTASLSLMLVALAVALLCASQIASAQPLWDTTLGAGEIAVPFTSVGLPTQADYSSIAATAVANAGAVSAANVGAFIGK